MNNEQRQVTDRVVEAAHRQIWITFRKEGIHCYPAAASDPTLEDVAFLAAPHRHIFHFRIAIDVLHNDRDIEFIQFKRWIESLYDNGTLALNYKSCEMMADDLYLHIAARHLYRAVTIEISEDGENGCIIEYNKH
jgi:hypothetical protein